MNQWVSRFRSFVIELDDIRPVGFILSNLDHMAAPSLETLVFDGRENFDRETVAMLQHGVGSHWQGGERNPSCLTRPPYAASPPVPHPLGLVYLQKLDDARSPDT